MSSPTPFVCDMTALSGEQRARHHEVAALLQSSLEAVRELSDGYDFEFPWELQRMLRWLKLRHWSTHAVRFSISGFALKVIATNSAGG